MLMGCNDAKAAPRTSQHPSRAHHSAHNNQGHSGALKGTQWHAHRSAVKSLRKSLSKSLSKRDGAAANARCRWTSRGRPQSVQGGPKSPSLTTARSPQRSPQSWQAWDLSVSLAALAACRHGARGMCQDPVEGSQKAHISTYLPYKLPTFQQRVDETRGSDPSCDRGDSPHFQLAPLQICSCCASLFTHSGTLLVP